MKLRSKTLEWDFKIHCVSLLNIVMLYQKFNNKNLTQDVAIWWNEAGWDVKQQPKPENAASAV